VTSHRACAELGATTSSSAVASPAPRPIGVTRIPKAKWAWSHPSAWSPR